MNYIKIIDELTKINNSFKLILDEIPDGDGKSDLLIVLGTILRTAEIFNDLLLKHRKLDMMK